MDKKSFCSLYEQEIDRRVESLLPFGAGTMTDVRLRSALDLVGKVAFTAGENYALTSLMTVDDMADQLGISARRVRAIAKVRHDRFGIGFQVPGTAQWLFRPSEVESLRPGSIGHPRKIN